MSRLDSRRPVVGLTLGDVAGIGPEIALAALADANVLREMRVLAIGPAVFKPQQIASFDPSSNSALIETVAWLSTQGPAHWDLGRVQAECGRAALEALRAGVEFARAKRIDALVTGPVSKAALHAAGEKVEGQTELLGRWDNAERFEMIAIAGRMRVMLLSRHVPLLAAIASITPQRVVDHLVLLDETLRGWGFRAPRIALAGLNPHAGEQGQLGREELDVLAPALELARARGVNAAGPISPDSVFLQASRGSFDAVLALYHDQAFIPVKLAAPETGLTVIAGLSFLRVSPAHGTAFDIAGKGTASPRNLIVALRQAAAWSTGRPIAVVE